MKNRNFYLLVGIALGVLAILFPFILPKFHLRMATEILIIALLVMTWKMMLSEGGLFSFGQAVYFGLGAYASVLGWLHIKGLSLIGGIFLGGLVAGLVGFILAAFLVRMSGTYYALLTLAFNQLIWAIVWKWRDFTGGDDGLGKFPKPDLLGISMRDPMNYYYLSLVIVAICLFLCWYFSKTPLGNVIKSINSNEERSKFIGLNVGASKIIFLTMLSFFAGVSGALYAQFQEFIGPSSIDLVMSTNIIFMSFIGGVGHFFGPLLGSGIYVYLSEYLSHYTDRWELIFGVVVVILVLFAPQGILGIIKKRK
jgi:branched-chain amino acid transport system permease protein